MAKIELRISENGSKALQTLRMQGLPVAMEVDIEIPVLPHDVTELGDEELMLLYSKFTQYYDLLCTQVACAQIDERDAEKRIAMEEAKAMLATPSTKAERVAILKAQATVDPEIVKLTEAHMALYNYRKLVEMMAGNAERDTQLLSRELTRRTAGANHYQSRRSIFGT